MPTYEYSCRDCGEHLEVVQSFKDDAMTECPHCGGRLRKVFGNIGIAFKGSGFYKTDSRSASSASKNGASESTSESKSEAKTDSKPEAKSESKSESSGSSDKKPSASSGTKSSSEKKAAVS